MSDARIARANDAPSGSDVEALCAGGKSVADLLMDLGRYTEAGKVNRLVAALRASQERERERQNVAEELDRMEAEEMLTLAACEEVGWLPLIGRGALANRIRAARPVVPPEVRRAAEIGHSEACMAWVRSLLDAAEEPQG